MGAHVVDTTPTQGLDKSSGKSRKGADVQRSERRKAMADALQPLTGMDAAQFDQFGKRQKLTPEIRRECLALDSQIPDREAAVRSAGKNDLARAEAALFSSRKRFRQIGC